jgi:hypothetical protein
MGSFMLPHEFRIDFSISVKNDLGTVMDFVLSI